MNLSHEQMLARFLARDRTADGRFLTGVRTTGIYCLPSCPARKPLPEHVRFFATPEAARGAGFRACRRCRPDDFHGAYDADVHLLDALAAEVRRRAGAFPSVDALVRASGVGATKLHALFRAHWQLSAGAWLTRERLRAARRLLREEPGASVAEVAFAAGYAGLSAFHRQFRQQTGLTPGEFRRLGSAAPEFTLRLPPRYPTTYVLRMIGGRDPESVTERVRGGEAAKALWLGERAGVLHLRFVPGAARCRLETAGTAAPGELRAAHAAAVRLLALGGEGPEAFERRITSRPELRRLIAGREGLRVPQSATVFEGVTWAVVGQQVNLAFAYALRRALAERCGTPAGGDGLRAHPTSAQVAALDYAELTALRFSRRKAEYLIDTARLDASGALDLEALPERPAPEVEQRLLGLRGFGPWSTAYVMMRACGFADCVPVGDTGLTTALQRFLALPERPGPAETRARMAPFAPFRTLATHHLWMSLGDPA